MEKVVTYEKITVGEVYQKSIGYLKQKGVQKPDVSVQILLSDVLNKSKTEIFLSFDNLMTKSQLEKMREYIKRRAAFEPPQYIIGYTYFYNSKIYVDKNVLIPRPETELLVDAAVGEIKNLLDKIDGIINISDLGCGSGNISIAIAKEFVDKKIKITAIDISSRCIDIARKNAEYNNVAEKIVFENKSFIDYLSKKPAADIILANPPYISDNEENLLPNEVRLFEPKLALFGERNGLKYITEILENSVYLLNKNFLLLMEIGWNQRDFIENKCKELGIENYCFIKDYNGYDRILMIRSRVDG